MTTRTSISNIQDIIDSRDLLKYTATLDETDDADELATLEALVQELRDIGGDSPEDGITLVRDSYFETYAQEVAADIGGINRNMTWPLNCIDWEKAAEELQMDYTSVDFDDVTYWVR